MGAVVKELLTEEARTIDLGRSGKFPEAIELVATGRGQQSLGIVPRACR